MLRVEVVEKVEGGLPRHELSPSTSSTLNILNSSTVFSGRCKSSVYNRQLSEKLNFSTLRFACCALLFALFG